MPALADIDPEWLWIVAALLLAIAEIIVPGVFLIWFGAAALLTGLATLAFDVPTAGQFALFALSAIGSVYAGRRFLTAHPIASADPLLNDRLGRLIGEQVIVVEAITDGVGRVRVGDGVWTATGPNAPIGARMHVIGAEQGHLVVARGG